MEIRGCTEVRATNVTFRNVRFVGNGCHYLVRNYSSGLRIEDAEANCNDGPNSAMAGPGRFTVLRADIHDCENGFDVQANDVVIQDSWFHNLYDGGDAHTDGIQIGRGATNIVIRHNSILSAGTSAIISWNEEDPQQQQVIIDQNLLNGGAYILYCPRQGVSDTRITNNRFGTAAFGYADECTGTHISVWSGNVRDSTGALLPPT